MKLYRSTLDWVRQYESNKQGYASALELFPFLRAETTAGEFNVPRSGTQGYSFSGSTPETDLTLSSNDSFKVNIDFEGDLLVTLDTSVLDTGTAIAEELETKINAASEAALRDGRVWVEYSDLKYKIYSQKTGTKSSVVITSADTNDVTTELLLADSEEIGTDSDDWIYVTSSNVSFSQEFEKSGHRSGRQASSIYKKKKMVEGSLEMYCLLNPSTESTIYMPEALKTVLTGAFGAMRVDSPDKAVFDMSQPHTKYMTMLNANNIFTQISNGLYIKNWGLELSGSDAAKISLDLKARDSKVSVPAKIDDTTSDDTLSLVAGEEQRFEIGSRVMICRNDGRSIEEGYAGDLYVTELLPEQNKVRLNKNLSTLTIDSGYMLVPYYPLFGYNIPADNAQISTDLTGIVSFDGGATQIDTVTSASVNVDPQLTDLDEYYGYDSNQGFVDSSRAEITVSVTMHLTADKAALILKAKRFNEFNLKVVVGYPDGQRMEVVCPRVVFKVPNIEIPEDGAIDVTFEGEALQTFTGANDALQVSYLAN